MENMAATIMSIFGRMWGEFMEARSFEPFMELYLERWIHSYVTRSLHTRILISLYFQSVHSDQLVTLDTVTPSIKVRIVGLTPEYGMLRTVPEDWRLGQEPIDLRPDGNSFDMMAGLIKTK